MMVRRHFGGRAVIFGKKGSSSHSQIQIELPGLFLRQRLIDLYFRLDIMASATKTVVRTSHHVDILDTLDVVNSLTGTMRCLQISPPFDNYFNALKKPFPTSMETPRTFPLYYTYGIDIL
jgi:hypothetical protein